MPRTWLVKIIVFFLFFSIISCENSKIISDKDKFASLYIELQLSLENNRGDLNKVISEREKIFRKYKVSKEQYDRTLEHYGMDKDKWDEFFNTVNAKLNKMKQKVY